MIKNRLSLFISLALLVQLFALQHLNGQVTLDTFVGDGILNSDETPICDFPIWPDVTPDLEGPYEGTLVHDFQLFTLEGDSVQLSQLLNDRKPVLLIGCNYTCYVFRGKMNKINDLQAEFGDDIHIYLVYTVEAHPLIDVSPYFGVENVGAENYEDGVLYRQPTTYGERKDIAETMLEEMEINVPVLIDDACNSWWLNYGTAPNCAFLIDPDGYVYDAQNWFNKPPEDMYLSVLSILDSVASGSYEATGVFEAIEDEVDDTLYGICEDIIASHYIVSNYSDDDVLIDYIIEDVSVPAGWLTYMCTDFCYSPETDSAVIYLTPGSSQEIRVDFYTDEIPAEATVQVLLRNRNDPSNSYSYLVEVESIESTEITTLSSAQIVLYPNPASESGMISFFNTEMQDGVWSITDINGQVLKTGNLVQGENTLSLADISAGNYFIKMHDSQKYAASSFVIIN